MDKNKDTLAREILLHCRKKMSTRFPFFAKAIYALKDECDYDIDTIATDGYVFYYNPNYIIGSFKNQKTILYIGILHLALHCLLRHFNKKSCTHYELFDISVDVFIYFMLHELKIISKNSMSRVLQSIPELSDLTKENPITISLLYDSAIRDTDFAHSLIEHKEIFLHDNHKYWVHPKYSEDTHLQPSNSPSKMWTSLYTSISKELIGYQFKGKGSAFFKDMFFGKHVTASKFSYEEYLQRLSTIQEYMKIDLDSFDLMWYTRGIELYDDIPIIEFNEYKDELVLLDLVLAIDTSGSCSGEVMENFLSQTIKIFSDMNIDNRKVNVTIIQCDDEITNETNLYNLQEINEYTSNFNAYGFGGTSFIPVFDRIEELRKSGQLINIKGLFYLSDGYGDFPGYIPDYETIFVLPGNSEESDYIPEWVTVVKLE